MLACMDNPIPHALSSVTLGDPASIESLTMFPLLGPPEVEQPPFYSTLDDAIAGTWTEITEVSDQGSVPELRVVNKGPKPVFILDGEELVGAKQNRVVNLSILVPECTTLTIPVSCVEAGRWRARSRSFSTAPRTQYAAGRAKRMSQVTASMQTAGRRYSDQAEVWADIAAKSARMAVHSETGAMEEIFVRHAAFADRCVETLRPVERQCGALFLIDGRVVGFDLFDSVVTLRRVLPKLVRSVAIDAIDQGMDIVDSNASDVDDHSITPKKDRRRAHAPHRPNRRITPALLLKVAEAFLERVTRTSLHESPAVGLGRDVRIVDPHLSGAALVANEGIVHLSAFHL
jgi:hypothetical protein